MLLLFLVGIFVYLNANLAKKKGLNPLLWSLLTIVAFFAAMLLLGTVYISLVYNGPMTQEAMKQYMEGNLLVVWTLIFLGIGGTLLVRFILEKTKDNPRSND
jgi:cytochrome bd-type quinol oxidase subunit 2